MEASRKRIRFELQQSLAKHLGFLKRSTEWYDDGHHSEAERIAVTLRVLFHSTEVSTALVKQLGMGNMLLRSSHDEQDDGPAWRPLILLDVAEGPVRIQAAPLLTKAHPSRVLTLPKWWDEEPVFWFPEYAGTRRELVLSLSNKDGAHVDPKMSAFDDALRTFYDLTVSVERQLEGSKPWKSQDYRLENALHASIRQIGYEVLETPALKRFMSRF